MNNYVKAGISVVVVAAGLGAAFAVFAEVAFNWLAH